MLKSIGDKIKRRPFFEVMSFLDFQRLTLKYGNKKLSCKFSRISEISVGIMKEKKYSLMVSCSKFFDKFRNFHFFRVFLRKCLKNSSKGKRKD